MRFMIWVDEENKPVGKAKLSQGLNDIHTEFHLKPSKGVSIVVGSRKELEKHYGVHYNAFPDKKVDDVED